MAERTAESGNGFCKMGYLPRIARIAPHYWEEPCISGVRGAGTIFFTGCNMRCVFCQNREISRSGATGRTVSVPQLRDLMLRLRDTGVHNIELVTPTHYARIIAKALDGLELGIPVVWNSSGYDSVETLRMLDGLVQIYLPDLKYRSSGHTGDSMDVIDFVADSFPRDSVLFSLMSQYTPMAEYSSAPELCRTVTNEENRNLIHYMQTRHICSGYWQEVSSAGRSEIPDFDGTGLDILTGLSDNDSILPYSRRAPKP